MMRDIDMPFHVVAQKNGSSGFVKGFSEKADAEANAQERNRKAEALGIETRYKALTKDGKEA